MRNGYRVLDTDCHHIEPPGMWADYIDSNFADQAPAPGDPGNGRPVMMVEGESLAKQDGKRSKRIRHLMRVGLTKLTLPFDECYVAEGFEADEPLEDTVPCQKLEIPVGPLSLQDI